MTEFSRNEVEVEKSNTRLFRRHAAEGIETVSLAYDFGTVSSRDEQLKILINEFEVVFDSEIEWLCEEYESDGAPFFGVEIDPEEKFGLFIDKVKEHLSNNLDEFYKILTGDEGPYIGDMTYFFVENNCIPLSKILEMKLEDPERVLNGVYIIKSKYEMYNNQEFTASNIESAKRRFKIKCNNNTIGSRLKLKYGEVYFD